MQSRSLGAGCLEGETAHDRFMDSSERQSFSSRTSVFLP
jgi:hypothetical protein